jgi:hypothetical protein
MGIAPATNNATINTCAGTFLDPGGAANYLDNQNFTTTFCSSSAGQCLRVTFTAFSTESGFDFLRVYDGPNTAGTLLGTYSGATLPPALTSSTGCLTFNFTSDSSVPGVGWSANFSCVACPPPPVCSNCANATVINSLPFTGSYTTCGACNSVTSGQACTSPYLGGEDYLFAFTPSVTSAYSIVLSGTLTWTGVFVTQGCPTSGGTCVTSNVNAGGNPAINSVALTAGVLYYIIVDTYPAPNCTPFNIAVNQITPPTNDLICNATPITCGQTVNGTTVNATPNGTGEGLACGGFTQNQPGVWYSIVGSGSNINASLCGTGWDSRIQVFTGANCNTVTCVGGNDNNGPLCAGNAASFSWLAVNGQTYYILVSGATAATSAFALSMACQTPCTATCSGGPPPANDACGGAQNLGAIPTPAACPNGVGTPVNFNTTNICATAEPNYTSLLGCQPAGNQAAPAADVWYRFSIVAPVLNITLNGLGTPNVALYEGINCANLLPRGCAIGAGGFLNTQIQGLAPGTYYLQVSGGDVLDQCNFTLTLQNNYDCQGCVLGATLDATPPPVNGQYQPGTLVTFCYQVSSYSQISSNWLHGVIPTFGPGWDLSTFVALPTTTVTQGVVAPSCTPNGTWSWYNTPITSSFSGVSYGPGFFFETALGSGGLGVDGNPGNNFGDNNPGAAPPNTNPSDDCRWTFCWQIRTKPLSQCIQDQNQNVTINTTADSESGSYSSVACVLDPITNFFAQSNCCPTPTVTVTNPTCAVPTGSAIGQGLGTSPWTYIWKNSAGVTLLTNANTAGTSTITGLAAGDYTLTVTDATGCASFIAFSIVAPAGNTVSGPSTNPTLCVNTPLAAVTFTTTGATGIGTATQPLPAGVTASFSGNATSGTITISGTPTASGVFNYSIPLTGGCGNLTASGTITVNPLMTATSTAPNATGCQNQALSPNIVFNTTGATGIGAVNLPAGLVATFAGNATAGTVTISGTPTSTLGSPFAYSVALSGGCGTVNAAGTITINSAPAVPTPSTTSLCAGLSSTFSVSGAVGSTLSWITSTGGSGVTPVIPALGSVSFGPLSFSLGSTWPAGVTITFTQISLNGCNTPLNIVVTVVSTSITASVTATSPICSGSTSTLTFTGTPSALVTYTIGGGTAQLVNLGPTGTTQVTTLALTANTIVTVTQAQVGSTCVQPLNNAFTIVVNTPTVPIFNPIGPYCFGTTAPALPATSTNSVNGTWSPATINTNIVGVTNYTFTPTGTCPASPVLVPVTINTLPTVYAHGTNPTCSTLCNGSAVVDITNGTAPYTIAWSNGGNTASISNLCEGTYNVTVTDVNGCVSQAFTPVSGCFQILSIAVDACGPGTEEGRNEMFFIQVGTSPLNLLSATVTWPANSFTNFNCSNAAFISAANAGITSGGVILPVPAGGILPANATVVIMSSSSPTINPSTAFANVSDTLYMAFHCSSTLPGYFANGSGSGTRALSMTFSAGCTDAVTYDLGPLVDSDGAYVNFSQSGSANYLDSDCQAPFSLQDNSVFLDAPDPVLPTFNAVGPYCSGATIPALPTSSTNVPPITGTWTPAISNTTTTTYTFTPTTGLCASSTTLPITITPLNTASAPSSNPTLCLNTVLTAITITTTGATGIDTPSGLPAGVTATWSNNVITISGTPTGPLAATTVFNYSIPLTGGCGAINATGSITVTAPTVVSLAYGGPYCPSFNSVSPTNPPSVGGSYSSAPGLSINPGSGLVSLNSSTPGTYTVVFTPTTGLCATQAQATVVIYDVLDYVNLQFPRADTICVGTPYTIYGQLFNNSADINTIGAGVAAQNVTVEFGYSTTNSNPNTWTNWQSASFNATGGGTNNDEYQGVISGLAPSAVPYYYTFRYRAFNCEWQYGGYSSTGGGFWNGTTNISGFVLVSAPPNAGNDGAISVCASGNPVSLLTSIGGGPLNTGTWSGPSALDSGSQGFYNPQQDEPGTYVYTVTDPTNACPPDAANVIVTETSSPQASIAYASPVCTSVSALQIPAIIGAQGGTFSASPSGLGLSAAGSFNPTTAVPGAYTITYTIDAASGCSAFQTQTTVVVQAAPIPPALNPVNPCSTIDSVFTATGGTWYEFLVNGVSTGPPSANAVLDTTALAAGTQVCVRSYPQPPIMDGNLTDAAWTPVIPGTTGGPASQAPFSIPDTRLDGLKMLNRNGLIYFAVAGNEIDGTLQIENNRILLFIDSKPGGFNSLSAWVNRSNAPPFTFGVRNLDGGIQFDPGFEADYILSINRANLVGSTTFYDLYEMVSNTNVFLGSSPSAQFGYQESFTDNDLSRGFEFYIPLTAIASPVSLKVFGMLVNDPGEFGATLVSNQFFSVAGGGDGNYGNGAIFFGQAAPNPVTYVVSQDCYEQRCVTLTQPVVPQFLTPAPICAGGSAPVLPTSSNNVPPITGTWSGPVSNQSSGTYTFTPVVGQCATGTTLPVTVNAVPVTEGIFHD